MLMKNVNGRFSSISSKIIPRDQTLQLHSETKKTLQVLLYKKIDVFEHLCGESMFDVDKNSISIRKLQQIDDY